MRKVRVSMWVALGTCAGLVAGCKSQQPAGGGKSSGGAKAANTAAAKSLPKPVMDTVGVECIDCVIVEVDQPNKNPDVYELEIWCSDSLWEVDVTSDGKVKRKAKNENENRELAAMPAKVRTAVVSIYPTGLIYEVDAETEGGVKVWDVDVLVDGQQMQVVAAEDGRIVSKGPDDMD